MGWQVQGYSRCAGKWNVPRWRASASNQQKPRRSGVVVHFCWLGSSLTGSVCFGRVEMWRGGGRFSLSVSAPFVWRCPSNLAVAPFPHPAHRTGHADLPHPALGQDTCLRPRKVVRGSTDQQYGPCVPRCTAHGRAVTTADATTWADIRFPDQGPSPSFTSASDAFCGFRAFAEFARVVPISSTSPLSTSALN